MESRAICILGMHRSGTSTITRAINFLGPYLGEDADLIPAAPDNPEGFWERADVVELHDRILERFKRTPDAVTPLPLNWHWSDTVLPFKEELRELIHRNFGSSELWSWKDPRTCLTLDLWKQLLSELSISLSCVFMVRNPIDVAQSLKKRNNMPLEKALGFWQNHNLAALEACSDLPTVFVTYDDFLEDWEANLSRVADALDLVWPTDDGELKKNITSFIQPGLRHNQSRHDELDSVPAPVRELYQLILEQTRKAERDEEFNETVRRLSQDYRIYSSFFDANMGYLFDRGKRLDELTARGREAAQGSVNEIELAPDSSAGRTNSKLASGAKRICSLVFGK